MSESLLKAVIVLAFFVGLSLLGLSVMSVDTMLSPPPSYGYLSPQAWWAERLVSLMMHIMFFVSVCAAMIALYAISQQGLTSRLATRCMFWAGYALCLCGGAGMLQAALQLPYHTPAFEALHAAGQLGIRHAFQMFLAAVAGNGKTLVIGFMLVVLARHLAQQNQDDEPEEAKAEEPELEDAQVALAPEESAAA